MALYFYKALSKEGKKVSGNMDGASAEFVRAQLSAKGLFPFEIKSQKEGSSPSFIASLPYFTRHPFMLNLIKIKN